MPSGSKKRKAAKKKKEKETAPNLHNPNQQPQSAVSNALDNDDLKHHDDKESEGEEVSSPASQDHPAHQHQFPDGEKENVEKVEDGSHVQLSVEESKSSEDLKDNGGVVEEALVEESVSQIEKELEPEGELNGSNLVEEHVVDQEESGVRVPQSKDEESVVLIEKELKPAGELNGKNIVEEHVEARKHSVDEESAVEIERELKPSEKLDASVEDVEPQKESSDGVLSKSHNDEYHVIDKTNVVMDNNPVPVEEVCVSVVESGSDTVSDNVRLAVERNIDNVPCDSLSTYNVAQPGMEENGKKEVVVLDQNDSNSTITVVDLGLEIKSDEAIAVADDAPRPSDTKNTLKKETEEKPLLSHTAPKDENCKNTSNGLDLIKDSEVTESSDTQPLVASAVRPVQRTSWLSCCGLFELLAGSNR